MNHFYRVIFNRSLGVCQVVSEAASSGRGAGSQASTSSMFRSPRLSALAALCLLAWCAVPHAQAATCDAATSAELVTCISSAGVGDTVNLTASITLAANLGVIDKNLTINGNGNTLDGAGTYRGFFIGSGTTTVNGLTMQNLRAQGGQGGSGFAGGGGMGAGGAVFVVSGAGANLNDVLIVDNHAIGGKGGNMDGYATGGGGGGMGGNGGGGDSLPWWLGNGGGGLFGDSGAVDGVNGLIGGSGGGPSGGAGGNMGNGGDGGAYSGGGGGGAATVEGMITNGGNGGLGGGGGGGGGPYNSISDWDATGGNGGFGGGGGGAFGYYGGAGGFGGGGGSALGFGGRGGFGGGAGSDFNRGIAGGGGAGMGGAIFVMGGGSLALGGNTEIRGNGVAGGAGGVSPQGSVAQGGSAFGSGIFMQGSGSSLTFAPGAGTTQTIADVIADQSGSGGVGANAGSVGITKTGAGTLVLSGANTYSGGTSLHAGMLSVSADNNLGNITGKLTFNSGALQNTAAFTTARAVTLNAGGGTFQTDAELFVTGNIDGNGGLTKTGAGYLVLEGNNTYLGETHITRGVLQIGNGGVDGTLGRGKVVIHNGALLFSRSDTLTVSNEISSGNFPGIGSTLVQDGPGTLILTGNNSYSETLIRGGGTLQIGDGVTDGSLGTWDVTNFSALAFNLVGPLTVANTIRGYGTLDKRGTGTLTLTGTNPYSGNTTISSGTLQVGNGGTTGSLGNGWGSVTNNASLVFNRSDTFTTANDISGTGTLDKQGTGTLILSGNNTYSGSTTISAGTLQLGNGDTTGSITGNVLNNGTLAFNRSDSALNFSGVISGSGNVRQTGTGTVTLSRANTYSGGTSLDAGTLSVSADNHLGNITGALTFSGGALQNTAAFTTARAVTLNAGGGTFQTDADLSVAGLIGGAGSLTKTGAGALILTGNNTYSGSTTISAGTLQIGNGGATGSITGNVLDNGTLAFNRSDSLTFSGVISGSGNVRQAGTGTVTLSGINTYSGATNLDAGTLSVSADNNLGNITGALTFNGGTLQNTAAFTTTRAITLNAGGGTLQADASLSVAASIGGAGSLTKTGTGNLELLDANTYSGSTTISAGTLQIGNGGTTGTLGSGSVTNNASLVFNRSDSTTLANVINGTGTLYKQGAGTLTVLGNNTYSGSTTISAGTLQVGNGGTTGSLGSGAVTNNAALVFNRSDAYTAVNPIAGTGTLTQNGASNLVLTGTNTYIGATTVSAGTLSVNGSITSATTVGSGAALGGSGSVGNVNVLAGGILAPGNSIGTLTVNGNLTFAPGSVYRVETDAAGNADRVNVVGAPGTLTINGGTVDVQAGTGNYARNTSYTILTSTGATTGAFTAVTSNLAFLTPTLSYQPNGVTLNLLAENAPSYSTVAQTGNQTSTANYLNSFANTPGNATASALIQQIDNLSADQARVAFDSLSGSPHAAASQIAGAMGRNFSATLATRTSFGLGRNTLASSTTGLKATKAPLFAGLSPSLLTRPGDVVSDSPLRVASAVDAADSSGEQPDRPALQSAGGLWGQAMGTGGRTGSDGNGAASRYRANGFVFGYDQPITSNWLAGAALAYNKAQWDASTNGAVPASGRISTPQAGLYARYTSGPWEVRLDGTYSDHRFSTDRTVTIGNASSIARSSHGGTELGLAAQAEYAINHGGWEVRPLAGLRHARLSEDGFTETGAGSANLTVDARRSQNTVASLGMKFIRPLDASKAGTGSMELRAIASHLMGDNDSPVTSRLAGQSASFTTAGTPLKRTALTLGGTLTGQLSRGLSAYADAAYEYRGAGQNAFQLTAGLKLAW